MTLEEYKAYTEKLYERIKRLEEDLRVNDRAHDAKDREIGILRDNLRASYQTQQELKLTAARDINTLSVVVTDLTMQLSMAHATIRLMKESEEK